MPPRYLRRASPTRLKPCQERTFEACDNEPTDGCCGVVPCALCLEWETYEDGIAYGSAEFATSSWTGTVGGGSFVAYWERNAYDECEFVVNFDGEEVYRATCYEGASCRNPAGEVAASIGYEEGTLRWSVYEPRELALIDDPETGCRDFFCGACRCTCDCLCVTITEPDGNIIQGELCTSSYPCDPPVWEGTLGYYDLSIALGRDEYTAECIISLTANGEEPEPVFVTGCSDMSASVTLYDGTIISVACKLCSCEEPLQSCCGCPSFGGNDGCIVFSSRDPCISGDRFDLNWSTGRGGMPASPTTWGTVTCEMFATINMGASIPGCSGADIDFTFVIFRVTDPDPSVASFISDCEWAMEVYADGVYLDMYLEYTNECQVTGVDDPLAWIQFPNVDIGGLGTSTVTSDFTIPNTKCS